MCLPRCEIAISMPNVAAHLTSPYPPSLRIDLKGRGEDKRIDEHSGLPLSTISALSKLTDIDYAAVRHTVEWICKQGHDGAILIFMPGWRCGAALQTKQRHMDIAC